MEYELDERGALQINLGTIQENLDPAVYPETDAYISAWFDAPDSTLDLFEISDIFLSCDKTQPLAPEIAEFVLPNYEYRAEKGDSDAMVTLGGLYYTGRLGEPDYHEAIVWYEKAQEAGNPQATENLGYCHYYGRSVPVDYEKAYQCFSKCAMQGMPNAMYKVGDLFRYGFYVNEDPDMAFHMYNEAYKNLTDDLRKSIGADVYRRLGDCFFEGIGTKPDNTLALALYQDAERWFYVKLADGDRFSLPGLEHVLERQQLCRKKLAKGIRLLRELET